MSVASSIVLGTAQFGSNYGIANRSGQPDNDQVEAILHAARRGGIRALDTAIAYGQSEARLGQAGVADMDVMSKLPAVPDDCRDIRRWVREQVAGSLQRLGLARLHALSLHRPEQLLAGDGPVLYSALCDMRAEGLTAKIGVSIYQPEELDRLCADYDFDLVQAPFNVFDRRLLDSGWIERLQARGGELHLRSVFLQGLLLLSPAARPSYFRRWQTLFDDWDRWLAETGLSPLQACLRFALSVPGAPKVVLGVDSAGQLAQILDAAEGPLPVVPAQLCSHDPGLLNPSLWPKT